MGVLFLFLWLVTVTKILRAITGVEIQLVKNGLIEKLKLNRFFWCWVKKTYLDIIKMNTSKAV